MILSPSALEDRSFLLKYELLVQFLYVKKKERKIPHILQVILSS